MHILKTKDVYSSSGGSCYHCVVVIVVVVVVVVVALVVVVVVGSSRSVGGGGDGGGSCCCSGGGGGCTKWSFKGVITVCVSEKFSVFSIWHLQMWLGGLKEKRQNDVSGGNVGIGNTT